MNKYTLIAIIPFLLGFKSLDPNYRGLTPSELRSYLDSISTTQAAPKRENKAIVKAAIQKKIKLKKKQLKMKRFSPSFGEQYESIKTLERFSGVVDGNIQVSSMSSVSFKVNISDNQKFPSKSYLACQASTFSGKYNYKVMGICSTLVTQDDEYEVAVVIKDSNLTEGINADFVYTGDEEEVIGEGFTAAMSAIIAGSKDRIRTAIGFSDVPNLKNAGLSGLIAAASSANNKTKKENNKNYVLLAVEDQKRVIIEFKKRFSYEQN